MLWNYLEIHPNPARLLRNLAKGSLPGAVILATATATWGDEPAATDGLGPCNPWELHGLIKNTGWAPLSSPDNFGQPAAAVGKSPIRAVTTAAPTTTAAT